MKYQDKKNFDENTQQKEVKIELLNKGLKIIQRNDHFNFSIDSLLISEFINFNKNTNFIIDLGTGNGAIPLFLSKKTKAKILGVEIQKISAELAKKNIEINNLQEQIEIINQDMKIFYKNNNIKKADIVVSNPPFFKFHGNENLLNDLNSLTLARHEISITLDELIMIASKLLKENGYFYLVHRADRLEEIILTLNKYNFAIKNLKFCYTTVNKNAKIMLVECLKNGKSAMNILKPLVINKENGEYTDEVLKMFY